MTTNKYPSKLFILVLMFFLSNPGLLLCQQFKKGNNIVNLDYEVFRDKPENDLLPHLQKNAFDIYNQLSRTIYLLSSIDQLCVDSLFVIDTIYFHGDRNFNDYRRSFTYDSLYKIKTIIAEAYKDSNWLTHQITSVIYNSSGNVVQINYMGYQSVLNDSIIINIEYDSNGLITKEVGEYLDTTSSLFKTAWIKNYNYDEGKLVEFKIRNIKYPNLTQPNLIKFKYNTNSLLIERIEYLPEKNFIDSVKYLCQFDEENNLIKCCIYYFENSDTSSMYVNNYYYNSFGKLLEEIKISADQGAQFTRKDEKMYYYNATGFLDSTKYMNKIVKGEVDSLDGSGIETYEYNPNGYLTGCTDFYKYKNSLSGSKVIIKRDLFENIISVQNEIWHNDNLLLKKITRIVYKRKEY
jgi:hypothetical protein